MGLFPILCPNFTRISEYPQEEHGQDTDALKRISPVAWQHINFYGRYEFNKYPEAINMEAIIEELAQLKVIPNE